MSLDNASPSNVKEVEPQSRLSLAGQALAWSRENIVNPALNAGVVEPARVVAQTMNAATEWVVGARVMREPDSFAVPQAQFLSANWFGQNIASGLAMVLPFTLAGKAAGGALKWTGRATDGALTLAGSDYRLGISAGRVLTDEKTAMIAGAGLYEGLKRPEGGQTRLGNALGGMAAFGIFQFGNPRLSRLGVQSAGEGAGAALKTAVENTGEGAGVTLKTMGAALGRHSALAGYGALGSVTGLAVSELVSQQKLPGAEQVAEAAVSGGMMNAVLPHAQRAVMRPFSLNPRWNESASLDRFVEDYRRRQIEMPPELQELYAVRAKGQKPKILVVMCSDSRMAIANIVGAKTGDVFVVRNAGNMVKGKGAVTSLWYAVNKLPIEHVIVMGHTGCGAMHARYIPAESLPEKAQQWIGQIVSDPSAGKSGEHHDEHHHVDQEALANVVEQVNTVADLLADSKFNVKSSSNPPQVHGWNLKLDDGTITKYDKGTGTWGPLLDDSGWLFARTKASNTAGAGKTPPA